MQIRTLNQIVNELKEIANQHLQINSFHAGTLDDFATSGDTRYPAMWVTYENAAIGEKTEAYSFTLFIVDRVKKDRSNLIEVHSDCKSILNDIKAQLNAPGYGWSLTQDWNYQALFEPFMEDEVAGWFADITITQAFSNDTCQIPFNQEPIPGLASTQPTNGSVISSYVPTSRTITINGVTYDLSTDRSWTISTTGGSGLKSGVATASVTDVYTTTISGVTSYTLNDAYIVKFNTANSDGATININGLGAVQLVKNNDVIITGGDIRVGQEFIIIYDGTNFQMLGIAPNQMFAYVTNADSVAITKGQPVYAFGASGDRMSVKLANNSSDSTSATTIGLVFSSSIAPNGTGFIITQGVLQNINAGAYNPGDILYVGSTAGTLTNVKPYAPNHLVYIGVVERANAGNGQIYVKPQNGYELDELHNVSAQNPTDNDIIVYSSGTTLWEKKNIYTAIGAASTSSNGYLTSTDWNTFNNKPSQDTYVLVANTAAINPVDGTTYYFGSQFHVGASTSSGARTINIPTNSKLIGYAINLALNAGSSENSQIYARINNTTDVQLGGNFAGNLSFWTDQAFNLNTSVSAADYVNIKIANPTWATNPTNVNGTVHLFFKVV